MGQSARTSDPRIEFWSNRDRWPDDVPPHYIFLGRVVDIVGRTVFGSEWTGNEPTTELLTPLPEDLHALTPSADLLRGCRLLFEHQPAYAARCPPLAEYLLNWPIPTPDEWGEVVTIALQIAGARRKEFGRFVEVASRLAGAFKHGQILTATRGLDGGPFAPRAAWFWNTENYWWRFHTCRVDDIYPYSAAPVVDGGEYLFVDQASLAAALEPSQRSVEAPVQREAPHNEYFSSYIRCMMAATRGMGITADDKRKKQDIVVELRQYWTGPQEDLTGEDLDRMATLIREPAHKGGRRFKGKA